MKMINDLLLTVDLLLNNVIKLNLSYIFFVQAKAATDATPNYYADCGGCGRLRLFDCIKHLQHASTQTKKYSGFAATLLPQALPLTDWKEMA